MARKSSLETLPEEVLAAAIKALAGGATINDVVERLQGLGHPRSRSAVGRYAQQYSELAKRQKDIRVVAETFVRDFGESGNNEGKLLMQMLTSIGVRMVMPIAAEDQPEMDAKEFKFLAQSIKDLMAAAKSDADRDAKVREQMKAAAAEAAVDAAKKAGASNDTINMVKSAILGIAT